ncbi:TRAP-type C4-dicarboxylate transport system substrate-binding protein [Geomicrobium halophilum]|uniref:TRAP-type C4-dicarboxylate transport system substrate-binding protein n=1 Tax=Geomicrobium halophilum TaxID=549000 RepID=A0A841PXD5_9BACL|nr:TRAP transporter substrate-binding protein [Geomicrobium halophilum]MBB6451331.1 TRAP-type C4-dicarboxylate transport system substrate-binding protein [Geomicrobium halophilum]
MMKVLVPVLCVLVLLGACDSGEKASGTTTEGEHTELIFSHFFPANHIQETELVQGFIDEIEEATEGRVTFTSYPGGQLADPDGHYEAAATGVADAGFSVHSYTPGQFPLSSVMELPFMSGSGTEGSETLWALYEEFPEVQDEYSDTVPLWLSTSEPGYIFTVDEPVESPEDLQGMIIRSPSPEVNQWLEMMGATPVSMPMGDTYQALEQGVVDGTVGPPHTLVDYGLQELVDYVTVGNFYMTTFFAVMNQEAWDSIGEQDQEAIEKITGENTANVAGTIIDDRAEEAMIAAEEAGAEMIELDDEQLDEWEEEVQPVIDNWIERMEEEGLPGEEVYDRALELGAE